MADKGNLGTGPYSKVVLDNTTQVASDTPYQISFVGDAQTGLYYKGKNAAAVGAGGVSAADWNATGFTKMCWQTSGSLTATGSSVADALPLTALVNFVDSAAASTGVILPSAATIGVGGEVQIFNAGANPIKVYGAGSDTIDGNAAATGVTLTNAKRCCYYVKAAATWVSAQLGVTSA